MEHLEDREYQKDIESHIESSELLRECIGAPTGAGKTIIFANITKRLTTLNNNNNVLIIVNREELLFQTKQKLHSIGIIPVVLNQKSKHKPIGSVMVAMAETLFRRLKKWSFSEYNIVIIDECFVAGTKVSGINIEEIQKGDYVHSYNHIIGEVELKKVLNTFKKPTKETILKIILKDNIGEPIYCTENHRVFVANKGYQYAKDIKSGDELSSLQFNSFDRQSSKETGIQRVQSVEIYEQSSVRESDRNIKTDFVYDIEVEDNHNYFANNILVHNCHRGEFMKLLDYFYRVIGFTATPMFVKKGKSLEDYYHHLYYPYQTKELIDLKYLAKPRTFVPSNMIKSFKTTMGDYDEKQQSEELSKRKYIDTVVKYWDERKGNGNCLVFNVTIEHSLEVESALIEAGANVVHIDGGTDKETRRKIRNRLENENDLWVLNVGVLTFGFDAESIRYVMINVKTKSIPKYNQMCGRGSRMGQMIEKDTFEILDMHGSCIECGTWDEEKNWQFLFSKKKNEKIGVAPIKFCPICESAIPQAATQCQYCGYYYVKDEKPIIYIDDDPNLTEYENKITKQLKKSIEFSKIRGQNSYKPLREMLTNEINASNRDGVKPNLDYIIDSFVKEMGWSHGRKWWIKTEYLASILAQVKTAENLLLNSMK